MTANWTPNPCRSSAHIVHVLAKIPGTAEAEVTRLRNGGHELGRIVVRLAQAMEAARIEMLQNGPEKAMQWILNSQDGPWEGHVQWDGSESADEWLDREQAAEAAHEPASEPASPEVPRPDSRVKDWPLAFALIRREDVTGVSGTGVVAHGAQFPNGRVVLCWTGEYASTVIWDSIDDAMHVHGHDGRTSIAWATEASLAAQVQYLSMRCGQHPDIVGYQDPSCGFCWHGRDGLDVPTQGGEPACPRCELAKAIIEVSGLRERVTGLEGQLAILKGGAS